MDIHKTFTVAVPPEKTWAVLTDLSRVANCMPGANLTDVDDDGVYHGTVDVKMGPASMAFQGRASFDELDAVTKTMAVTATGTERRGRGGVQAHIKATLAPESDATRVDVVATLDMSGTIAQLGRRGGILEDVSEELIAQFVADLREDILSGRPSPATPSRVTAPQDPATEPATEQQAAARPEDDTLLDPVTGLWGYLPTPAASPGAPAERGAVAARAVPSWPPAPPPAPARPPRGPSGGELSAMKFAGRIARRRARRLIRRLAAAFTRGKDTRP